MVDQSGYPRFLALLLSVLLLPLMAMAEGETGADSVPAPPKKELCKLRRMIRGFSEIDTRYIEPQHYNYTVMLQSTTTYDFYRLSSVNGQTVTFSPDVLMKVGPYVGWRWFFLGYTFDLKNIGVSGNDLKKEIDFSIYSSQIGIDLFYRRTGNDYKIREVRLGDNIDTTPLDGVGFNGVEVGITGVNLYYIFNHKRFSYPAAFAQSTCQKVSCGSWMAGFGYMKNSLEFDYRKLEEVVENTCGVEQFEVDSGLRFNKVRYYDYHVSAGYAYNWVFAPQWLFCASAQLALAYKRSTGDTDSDQDFSFNNFNFDSIGRFGLVFNNTRWYAGASAIVRSYNYRKERFATNNIFGSLNIYVGYNFGKKKRYR